MIEPNRPGYTGYIPSEFLQGYDPALYDKYGKAHPYHYWWDGNSQYKTPYDDPQVRILVYQGSEVRQIEEAGGMVIPGSLTPSGLPVVTFPETKPAATSPTVQPGATVKVNIVEGPPGSQPVIYTGPPKVSGIQVGGSLGAALVILVGIAAIFGNRKRRG